MRNIHGALIFLVCVLLVASLPARVGYLGQDVTPPGQLGRQSEKDSKMREWERQQEKTRNTKRHEDLKKDTDRLLQLATDLKLAVDKSNEQTLSMNVIKKAGEVEKLAKDIQRKMKGE